jgi:hypothetical protein
MKWISVGVVMTDLVTSAEGGFGLHYGHPGTDSIQLYIDLAPGGDIEGVMTVAQASALAEAVRAAVEHAPGGHPPETGGVATIPCTDIDTGGEGRVTLRYDDTSVAMRLWTEQYGEWSLKVVMEREEAGALLYLLKAAVEWTSRYRCRGQES